MNAVIAGVRATPLLAAPSLSSGQVSQLVLGEAARIVERDGEMIKVRTLLDEYEGWLHRGYVHETSIGNAEMWLVNAAWSEGAALDVGGVSLVAPHRARLAPDGEARVRLPNGRSAKITSGSIRPWGEVMRDNSQVSPAEWAWREFAGAPYLWGGVTTAGVDCSGLVQTTFLARGIPLPRDSRDQASIGSEVDPAGITAGDLLFFRDSQSGRVDHVAIAADNDNIVHSTADTGQVTLEPWVEGSRAASLRGRLHTVRRLT